MRSFATAIDDFGAAYADYGLLAAFQPDIVEVDMSLVRGIDADPVRLAIVRGVGVRLFQGYLFSRPAIATLPPIAWDAA